MRVHESVSFAGDEPGDPPDSYDFSSLGLPGTPSRTLLAAFSGVTSTYRVASRKQAWASLRKFAKFLNETKGDPWKNMLSCTVSLKYEEWLKNALLLKTGGSHYNFLRLLYAWLGANDASRSVVWMNVHFPVGRFGREEECPRQNILSPDELRSVLVASKRGIDDVRSRMGVMTALASGAQVPGVSTRDREVLDRMREGVANGIFGKRRLCDAGYASHRSRYRALKKYLHLEICDYIPYIVYMTIETGANPGGLMSLRVDCIRDHAVDPLKKVLTWDKFRATKQSSSTVTAEGAYAIPTLMAELIEFTSSLRLFAGARADRVFLSHCRGRIDRASVQGWHHELEKFIERHGLPDFNFVDLRLSGARILGNGGARIEQIQSKLQHKRSSTTGLYIRSPERRGMAREKLLGFMGKIVQSANDLRRSPKHYKTAQGYDCVNATSGEAPGSRRGRKCTDFLHCAFCPNSVAVLDSPRHVARMVAANRELDAMKALAESSSDASARYRYAYEGAHCILAALLSRVTKDVLLAAEKLSVSIPIIGLE